jgi:3-oxoacyl-[acyl-carrier-protein] synthase-1
VIRAGQRPFMVAGGVDSYRDLYVLGTLDQERRVKSDVHLDGFIPGEGAAFLLLAARGAAEAAGLAPLATLSPAAVAVEAGHLYSEEPYRGDGLAAALARLFGAGALAEPVQEVYSSMNGESHWAKEWGVGFLRNRAGFRPDHGMHHPADCLGDTGAACGPLLVGLAALGVREGYRRSPCLVYGSSDDGLRAALAVARG